MNNLNKYEVNAKENIANNKVHLQWFGDEPVKEPVKEPVVKEPVKPVDLDTLYKEHPQDVEKWIKDNEVVKKVMAPWKDSMVTQAIHTYQEKTEPSKIQEAVDKYRVDTAKAKDPVEAVRLEMNAKFVESDNKRKRAEIKSAASEAIAEMKINLGKMNVEDFVAGTEEETREKLNKYYETIKEIEKTARDDERKQFVKDNTYIPPAGTNEAVPFGGDEKAHAKAIKEGRSPSSGDEFMKIRDAIAKYKYGKK
jgi:hypothetical protein